MIISIAPLPGQNYNYNGSFFCDITASPLGCNYPESTTTCIRGADARDMLLYVGIIPFMVAFFIIIVAVVLLIDAVVKQERRMDRYLQEGAPLNRTLTKQTTRQGLYYIAAFGLAWIPWYICEWWTPQLNWFYPSSHLMDLSLFYWLMKPPCSDAFLEYYQQRIPEALAVFHYTTMPLQGGMFVAKMVYHWGVLFFSSPFCVLPRLELSFQRTGVLQTEIQIWQNKQSNGI